MESAHPLLPLYLCHKCACTHTHTHTHHQFKSQMAVPMARGRGFYVSGGWKEDDRRWQDVEDWRGGVRWEISRMLVLKDLVVLPGYISSSWSTGEQRTYNSSLPLLSINKHKRLWEFFKGGMALVFVGGTRSENAPSCAHLKPYKKGSCLRDYTCQGDSRISLQKLDSRL